VILTEARDAIAGHLASRGIEARVYYPVPMHLQDCYRDLGYKKGDFPVSERVAGEALAIPIYPELKEDDRKLVAGAIKEAFEHV
jgi:dTDP-4-amino-4,6-dideoxygalactose transaminase